MKYDYFRLIDFIHNFAFGYYMYLTRCEFFMFDYIASHLSDLIECCSSFYWFEILCSRCWATWQCCWWGMAWALNFPLDEAILKQYLIKICTAWSAFRMHQHDIQICAMHTTTNRKCIFCQCISGLYDLSLS